MLLASGNGLSWGSWLSGGTGEEKVVTVRLASKDYVALSHRNDAADLIIGILYV